MNDNFIRISTTTNPNAVFIDVTKIESFTRNTNIIRMISGKEYQVVERIMRLILKQIEETHNKK